MIPLIGGRPRSERVASLLLLAASLGLAFDAVSFVHYSPATFVGNLVQWYPESYVAYYFAIFSIVALSLSVAVYPFGGTSIFRVKIVPWASSLNDSALCESRLNGSLLILGMSGMIVAFLIARLAFLPIFNGPDEGLYRSAALQIFKGCEIPPLVGEGSCNLQHPPLAKLLIAASMNVGGKTLSAAKLPSVLLGTLTIPLAGYIMWTLTKNQIATFTTVFLLCLDPMFFGWTTLANLDAAEIFFTAAGIALYVSSRKGSSKNLGVGALMGLAILSKEVAVFGLAGLVTYHLVTAKDEKTKGTLIVLCSAFGTFALGLQVFDSLFTPFPNLFAHASYMVSYASHEILSWSNPLYWLISITGEPWPTYFILNIFASTLALVWLPIGIWRIRRSGNARALILASVWLFWTYVPFEIIYLTGRVEYYYYAVQMVPALALGGAYIVSSSKFSGSFRFLILCGTIVWFAMFFPLSQPFLPKIFVP